MASSWLKVPSETGGEGPPWAGYAPGASAMTVIRTPQTAAVDEQLPGAVEASVPPPAPEDVQVWARLFPSEADLHANDPEKLEVAGIEIDHFRLIRKLGVGGMGAVFLADDIRLARQVALKVLAPWQSRDPAVVKRFQNEARAAASLDHEHIASVFYCGENQGLHYIAFEYVQGVNLRDLIQEKSRLSPAEAVNYSLQLASALTHTSNVGVVHRDIKPSNVIITPLGQVKLVDLGLARQMGGLESNELTVAGTTLGTFDYISPEQARDPRTVDVRSDIYSLGCTLYHMLTGEPPYPEGTVLQKLLEHQSSGSPDPAKKNRRVSQALSLVVRKMMESDPRHRYPNPNELIRDLVRVARQLGLRALPSNLIMTADPEPAPTSTAWIWSTLVAMLILVVVLLDRVPALTNLVTTRITNPDHPGVPTKPSHDSRSEIAAKNSSQNNGNSTTISPPNGSGASEPQNLATVSPLFNDVALAPLTKPPTGNHTPANFPAKTNPTPENPPASPAGNSGSGVEIASTNPGAVPPTTHASTPNSSGGNGNTSGKIVPVPPAVEPAPAKVDVPATVPVDPALPFWIEGGKGYPSLNAACSEARDGSVIELRYDGRRKEKERPIRLSNKRLTIRGALGMHPILEFRPTQATDFAMIFVEGGGLELMNLEIEWNLAEAPTQDGWILFALERPEKLRLRKSVVTVNNPRGHWASVCELTSGPGAGTAFDTLKGQSAILPSDLQISQSVIRGESHLCVLREPIPCRFTLEDSLCVLSENLLKVTGARNGVFDASQRFEVSLHHSTCLVDGSLIFMRSPNLMTDRLLPVHVTAHNNVLACGRERSLVELHCSSEMQNSRNLLTWTGDRNYYDDVGEFWWASLKEDTAQRIDRDRPQTGFEKWRNFWPNSELNSYNQAVEWSHPWASQPRRRITPFLVELESADGNRAYRGASDGTNAGANLDQLLTPID